MLLYPKCFIDRAELMGACFDIMTLYFIASLTNYGSLLPKAHRELVCRNPTPISKRGMKTPRDGVRSHWALYRDCIREQKRRRCHCSLLQRHLSVCCITMCSWRSNIME